MVVEGELLLCLSIELLVSWGCSSHVLPKTDKTRDNIQRWNDQNNWCIWRIVPHWSQGPFWSDRKENENKTPQRSKGIIYSILQRRLQVGGTKSRTAGSY